MRAGLSNSGKNIQTETSPPATPTEPLNHIVGRPFPPGYKGPRRPRPGTELQLRYRKLVWKIVTAAEWEKTVRTMLEVSQNPANRQCVAAASWIADRVMGPVAALMQLDVTSGGESLEDKRQALLARFAELYGVAGPVVDALPAPDEEQIPPDSP